MATTMQPTSDNALNLNVDLEEIDSILDELEENERKQNNVDENAIEWQDILNAIKSKKVGFIKNLISSKQFDVNNQHHLTGKTILIYAVIIGNMDLVKTVCNFGADVHIKDDDGFDALDYAIKYGRYKITELVYYRQLSGSLGNDLKSISMQIHKQNKQAKYIYDNAIKNEREENIGRRGRKTGMMVEAKHKFHEQMTEFMILALKEKAPFDPSLFYYAWYFEVQKQIYGNGNVFKSDLWRTMMSVYEQILSDTNDKKGWKWLKEQFIPSLIWYLPHPNSNNEEEEKENDN
eukprot:59278_1